MELLPPETSNGDLIRCKLHTYSLDEAPEYEAISYTWGLVNTQDFPVIVVTDTAIPDKTVEPAKLEAVDITRHLYAALRRLRHPTQSRFLWADQTCINQFDKGEKSKQVRQMGDIYSKSKRTVIWLGEEDQDKDVITDMFTWLIIKPRGSLKDDCLLFWELFNEESTNNAPHMTFRKQRRRQAVTRLLNRAWFSRVWVFQEAVVSPEVEAIYGSLKLPLEELARLTRAVYELENAAGGYARSIAKRTVGFDTLYLIQHNRRGGCGDPDCPRNKSSARGDEKSKYDLPSWVPDFSKCYPYAGPITASDFKTAFNAAGGLPHLWGASADTETLIVRGKMIGTILWFTPLVFDVKCNGDEPQGTKAVLDYKKHATDVAKYIDIHSAVTPQKRQGLLGCYNSLVRALLADGAFGHEQPLRHSIDEIIQVCENEDRLQAANDMLGRGWVRVIIRY
ncbi:Heterokaryon incompatibility [Metarhizium guizhouense ARSEF 977]|uniref:Heterokaryon incompatibility n=1 Tax=Metarhizium guizhouense (strain ARSEF 977) TaxID=1276136 RepID=A0A0B4H1N9_METGA|nr:Heterokaryon incompatibility [Metarhizium guizhouense ARSEF 977]